MSALEIKAAEPVTMVLADLTRDPELSCRAKGTSKRTVAEYAEAMKGGAIFPPVVVFVDSKGTRWLADGFHRCAAAELAGQTEVSADVREGGRRDALLYAASANAAHGLRRTNADKRKAVLALLGNFPKWSDRKIGEACGVDNKTVAAARKSVMAKLGGEGEEIPQSDGAAAGTDPLVAKLRKALERVFEQWPPERRAELRALLDAADKAPEGKP